MKKRLPLLLLALLMIPALLTSALADVLWEPYGNSFYEKHRDDCVYESRSYLANGADGYVTFYSAPGSGSESFNLPNGDTVSIGFTYDDNGTVWGVGEYRVQKGDGYSWYDGWAPMSELALVYDSQCFEEDHADEFESCSGNASELGEVMLYSYPGGVAVTSAPLDVSDTDWAEYDFTYTDASGLRWSMLGYIFGYRNVWFCIDDPANEGLGIDAPMAAAVVRGEMEKLTPVAASVPAARAFPMWAIPVILIVLAAAVTAVLAGRRKAKKRG